MKTIKILSVYIFINLFQSPLNAQGWTKTYGGPNNDWSACVEQTSDAGFIIAGTTVNSETGQGDIYLVKTDFKGDTIWTRTFGWAEWDGSSFVQQTFDGGYIISANTKSFNPWNETYLIKTNSDGDSIWTKNLGFLYDDYCSEVHQTSDSGFIIVGRNLVNGWNAAFLIKTDSNGDKLWSKSYGVYGQLVGGSVQQTTDGGFIISGRKSNNSYTSSDVYLIKTDCNGDTIWTKTIDIRQYDSGNSVLQTSDGGFIVVGNTEINDPERDILLIKTNSDGDILWIKTFHNTINDGANSIQETFDGGFFIVGFTGNFGWNADSDVFLIKTDGNGTEQWRKTYAESFFSGRSGQQTTDGGYIITGFWSDGNDENAYLIKTDFLGNVCYQSSIVQCPIIYTGDSFTVGNHVYNSAGSYVDTLKSLYGCDSIIITHLSVVQPPTENKRIFENEGNYSANSSPCDISFSINEIEEKTSITVFPNPSSGLFTVESSEKLFSIVVTNLIGEKVFEKKSIVTEKIEIKLTQPGGIYFFELEANGKKVMKKIILQ